jgi:hypothetical protein
VRRLGERSLSRRDALGLVAQLGVPSAPRRQTDRVGRHGDRQASLVRGGQQRARERPRICEARARLPLERALDHEQERDRFGRACTVARKRWRARGAHRLGMERGPADYAGVQQRAERPKIAGRGERAALHVLRRHEARGADQATRLSQRRAAFHLGDAEVEQLWHVAPVGRAAQKHVAGLDVAVQEAALVRERQHAEQRQRQLEHRLWRERATALQPLVQGRSRKQLEHQERAAIAVLTEVEHLDDVRVAHADRRVRLALEPQRRDLGVMRPAVEQLDRDLAAGAHVTRAVQDTRAAHPQERLDPITLRDHLADAGFVRTVAAAAHWSLPVLVAG